MNRSWRLPPGSEYRFERPRNTCVLDLRCRVFIPGARLAFGLGVDVGSRVSAFCSRGCAGEAGVRAVCLRGAPRRR
eukprot:9224950-Alexandrium_andersonii.AAC.1